MLLLYRLAKCGVNQGDMLLGRFTFSKSDKVKKKVSLIAKPFEKAVSIFFCI